MVIGYVEFIGKDIYIVRVGTQWNEPVRVYSYYLVEAVEPPRTLLREGDRVTMVSGGVWRGPDYEIATSDRTTKVETEDVPKPKAGGKKVRWSEGGWWKLLKKGWVRV